MIRVNPFDWTADFRIARALAEAYKASGFDDVLFFCVGDPADPIGRLGVLVADETIKYYKNVMGTSDAPITRETLARSAAEALEKWPGRFIIAVEAGSGLPAHLGSVEITDRGLMSAPPDIAGALGLPDVTVNVVLRVDEGAARRREAAAAGGGRETGRNVEGLRQAELEIGTDGDGAALGRRNRFKPLRPEQITDSVVRKLADTVIDGNLRLLSKIGKQKI